MKKRKIDVFPKMREVIIDGIYHKINPTEESLVSLSRFDMILIDGDDYVFVKGTNCLFARRDPKSKKLLKIGRGKIYGILGRRPELLSFVPVMAFKEKDFIEKTSRIIYSPLVKKIEEAKTREEILEASYKLDLMQEYCNEIYVEREKFLQELENFFKEIKQRPEKLVVEEYDEDEEYDAGEEYDEDAEEYDDEGEFNEDDEEEYDEDEEEYDEDDEEYDEDEEYYKDEDENYEEDGDGENG